jgi:threonine dehydratase
LTNRPSQWIVEGYSTVLREVDAQLPAQHTPTHILTPVGVGSLAQAVVTHYASPTNPSRPTIIAVEPDTAACLHNALTTGMSTAIETQPTILAGLNCGTVSLTAWPLLRAAVSVAVTVSDHEAHTACTYLYSQNVDAGPCGGATVAALRRLVLSSADRHAAGLDEHSVLVLLCTEGARAYYYAAEA